MLEFMQIVYSSTLRPEFSGGDTIAKILEVAREKNKFLGVTGLLIFNGGSFLQLLEGERKSVMNLFGRICCDQRHFNINTLLAYNNGIRLFPEWSMCYKNLNEDGKDHSSLKTLTEKILEKSLSHQQISYDEVLLLLKKFRFSQ